MRGRRPCADSKAEIPQKAAGILRLPPISLPIPIGETLAATDAPSPPELPPADFFLFQGLSVLPHRKLLESKHMASWGRLVFINGIIPAFLTALERISSSFMMRLARAVSPTVDVVPASSMLSFSEMGTPNRGGRQSSISHSLSSRVQLFLPLFLRILSHSSALCSAYSKQSSVMVHISLPIVAALSPKIATNCRELTCFWLRAATRSVSVRRVMRSCSAGGISASMRRKVGVWRSRRALRRAMAVWRMRGKLGLFPIVNIYSTFKDTSTVYRISEVGLQIGTGWTGAGERDRWAWCGVSAWHWQTCILFMEDRQVGKGFQALKLQDSGSLTPDHPDFFKPDVNLAVFTKYGRSIYIRHGNDERCSSFFATLGTIVNKLEISFGTSEQQPAKLKCVRQGPVRLYLARRLNYMYVCWARRPMPEVSLSAMMDFVHHQLMSCLTAQVNTILDSNQTYDPAINFGKTRTEHLLLHTATATGLTALPVAFNALPVMPLPASSRSALMSLLREQRIEGLQISVVMTLNEVVAVHRQKGIDLHCYDIFLFTSLIQSQSSLFRSEIWYPICLPGVEAESRVFCYINFISEELIHIMVADQADIFSELSEASRRLAQRCRELGITERVQSVSKKDLISDPSLQRMTFVKHFLFRYTPNEQTLPQMVMSSGNYFGHVGAQMEEYAQLYAELHQHLVSRKHPKKEKMHVGPVGEGLVGGYAEEGGVVLFFLVGGLCDLEDVKAIVSGLMRFAKEEDPNLWLHKFS